MQEPGNRFAATRENRQYELSYRITTADSKVKWVWEKGSGVYSPENKLIALEGFISDVTEHKNLENQLRHAQKMEAIGLLSGGIAHDFNNIINVIMGFASLLEMEIDRESPMFSHLKQIFTASDRAANLTKSLLAFSRKQAMELRPVNLNDILHRMQKLFKVLIREDIELKIRSSTDELRVMADAGQLEQVLVNLTTNAVDAMPLGGMLDISVMEINLDQEYKNVHGYGIPGRYALLTFSDTGHGMDEATRQKIFEPFFTTKETGKGTGLGLSIIYGITKQHNGYINCYSEPGKGTTFKIYLPIIDKSTGLTETTTTFLAPQSGVEMILLAEDDSQLRDLTKNVLEGYGYTVIAAVDGEDALAKFAEHGENIHLTVLDVIMPKKNGREVFEEIRKIRHDSKVLFTSGYPEEVFNKDEIESKGMDFIAKPVIPMDLLKKIRQVLDRQN
jgi:two-component system cell cycle sensor histidine kinase/response regulator CckA